MRMRTRLVLLFVLASLRAFAADQAPADWIDPDTGHRVIRISPEPDSASLYFHQNFFSPKGDKMIFDSPSGIAVVDLKSLGHGTPKVSIVVSNASALAMSRKAPEVYFYRRGALCAANIDTGKVREITRARVTAINCDETFVVSTINAEDPSGKTPQPEPRPILPQRERMFFGRTNLTQLEAAAARKEDGLSRRLNNGGGSRPRGDPSDQVMKLARGTRPVQSAFCFGEWSREADRSGLRLSSDIAFGNPV